MSHNLVKTIQAQNVSAATPADGYVLTYDTPDGYWVGRPATGGAPSGAAGGDLSSTYPNPTVAKIQGKSVNPITPADGYVLTYITADGYWAPRASSSGSTVPTVFTDDITGASSPFTSTAPLNTFGTIILAGTPDGNIVYEFPAGTPMFREITTGNTGTIGLIINGQTGSSVTMESNSTILVWSDGITLYPASILLQANPIMGIGDIHTDPVTARTFVTRVSGTGNSGTIDIGASDTEGTPINVWSPVTGGPNTILSFGTRSIVIDSEDTNRLLTTEELRSNHLVITSVGVELSTLIFPGGSGTEQTVSFTNITSKSVNITLQEAVHSFILSAGETGVFVTTSTEIYRADSNKLTEITYRPGTSGGPLTFRYWSQIKAIIAGTTNPLTIIGDGYFSAGTVNVPSDSGITDCKFLVTLKISDQIPATSWLIEDGAQLKDLVAIEGGLDLTVTTWLSLHYSGDDALPPLSFSCPGNVGVFSARNANIFWDNTQAPAFDIPAGTTQFGISFEKVEITAGTITVNDSANLYVYFYGNSFGNPGYIEDNSIISSHANASLNFYYDSGIYGGAGQHAPIPEFTGFAGTITYAGLTTLSTCIPTTTPYTTGATLRPGELAHVDTTDGYFDLTLPPAAFLPNGGTITVKCIALSPNPVTILADGGLIDGVSSFVLTPATVKSSVTFVSNAPHSSDWDVIIGPINDVITEIIFKPGGTTNGPVYATWAEIQNVINGTKVPLTIYFDESIVGAGAIVIPGGSGVTNCRNLVTLKSMKIDTQITIQEGATLLDLFSIDAMKMNFTGTATVGLDFSNYATEADLSLINAAELINSGSFPVIIIPNPGILTITMVSQTGYNYVTGGITGPGIVVRLAGSGSEIYITQRGRGNIDNDTIDNVGSPTATQVNIDYDTSINVLPTFAGYSGTVRWDTSAGFFALPLETRVTSNYTMRPNELIAVDTTGGGITVTLPTIVRPGQMVIIKVAVTSGNSILVVPDSTIDDNATDTISCATKTCRTYMWSGEGLWYIISSF